MTMLPSSFIQTRQEAGSEPSVTVTAADGSTPSPPRTVEAAQTAAVIYAVRLLSRAFMAAEVMPRIPALSPEYLGSVITDIMLHGEHIAFVRVARGQIQLLRASYYNVRGDADPNSWVYLLNLPAPTRPVTSVRALATDVVHIRMNPSRDPPLGRAVGDPGRGHKLGTACPHRGFPGSVPEGAARPSPALSGLGRLQRGHGEESGERYRQ